MSKEEYLNFLKREDILYMLMDYIYNYQDEEIPEGLGAEDLWETIKTLVLSEIV
jgi:hypothetical protein